MMYIIVTPDNRIKMLNFPNDAIQPHAINKSMLSYPEGTRVFDYDKSIPEEPIDTWIWNDKTQTIDTQPVLAQPNWAGLMADLPAISTDLKLKLTYFYPSIIQALLEQDKEYLIRLITSAIESLPNEDIIHIWDILNQHQITYDTDEPPF